MARGRVPEGVKDVAWLPDIRACCRFGLVLVDVRVDQHAGFDRVLNDGEASTGLLTAHLEVNPEPTQVEKTPTMRR